MARVFDEFPQSEEFQKDCPFCNSHHNEPCILIPIEGTQSGFNAEAVVAHLDCLLEHVWMYPNNSYIVAAIPDRVWSNKQRYEID